MSTTYINPCHSITGWLITEESVIEDSDSPLTKGFKGVFRAISFLGAIGELAGRFEVLVGTILYSPLVFIVSAVIAIANHGFSTRALEKTWEYTKTFYVTQVKGIATTAIVIRYVYNLKKMTDAVPKAALYKYTDKGDPLPVSQNKNEKYPKTIEGWVLRYLSL